MRELPRADRNEAIRDGDNVVDLRAFLQMRSEDGA
jgi:hypothetical protein